MACNILFSLKLQADIFLIVDSDQREIKGNDMIDDCL
jgi:hypothetical protein